jgi:hypothetical protein
MLTQVQRIQLPRLLNSLKLVERLSSLQVVLCKGEESSRRDEASRHATASLALVHASTRNFTYFTGTFVTMRINVSLSSRPDST